MKAVFYIEPTKLAISAKWRIVLYCLAACACTRGPSQNVISPELSVQPLSNSALIGGDGQALLATIIGVTNATVTAYVRGVQSAINFTNMSDTTYGASLVVPLPPAFISLSVVATSSNSLPLTNDLYYQSIFKPVNDTFGRAFKVPPEGGVYTSNNRLAINDPRQPENTNYPGMGGTLWWAWTPSISTNALIDTSGSKVDSVVEVYSGPSLSELSSVGATNGSPVGPRPAVLSLYVTSGEGYYIAVSSANSNVLGSLRLAITPGAGLNDIPPTVKIMSPQSGITVTNALLVITGIALLESTNSAGINNITVTLNGLQSTSVSGTSNWTSVALLQPGLNFIDATAYDEEGNSSTPTRIEVNYLVQGPANDFFCNASQLILPSGTNSFNNSNATKESGEPNHAGNEGGKSLWWKFAPDADGILNLSTAGSTFPAVLSVYTGSNISNLLAIASDDASHTSSSPAFSFLSVPVHSNLTYHIAIDGYNGVSGDGEIEYSFLPTNLLSVKVNVTGYGSVNVELETPFGPQSLGLGFTFEIPIASGVAFTATPGREYVFDHWDGAAVTYASKVTLLVTNNVSIDAIFAPVNFSDDFESGTLTHLNWLTTGDAPWVIESTNVSSGIYAVRSGSIGDAQTSALILQTNFAQGIGSFDVCISSELYFDQLQFMIDGDLTEQWSGDVPWTTFRFPLSGGPHVLEWRYVKDPSISAGLDACFLDNVALPIILPKNSSTAARLQCVRGTDGTLTFRVLGQTNQQYVVEVSTDLVHWHPLFTGDDQNGTLRFEPDMFSSPVGFYRAVVP